MIPILGILAVLLCSVKVQAEGVVISELMPVNRTTLADDDGDFSDWIEIHNPTDQPVNLLNHGLSDDPVNPFKWRFPEHVLGPGKRTLVFASGKDRRSIRPQPKTIEPGLPLTIPGLSLWLDASDKSSLVMDDTGAVQRWKSKTKQLPQIDPAKHKPIDPGTVAGLKLWLDSSDKKSLQIENGRLKRWLDKGDNNRHAEQSRFLSRPNVFEPPNGPPLVVLDGKDDHLLFDRLETVRSVFWVVAEHQKSSLGYRPLLGDSEKYHFARAMNGSMFHDSRNSVGREGRAWIDGTEIDPFHTPLPIGRLGLVTSISDKPGTASNLASDRFLPGRSWHGRVAEVLLFDRALDEANRIGIEQYLVNKWGLADQHGPLTGDTASQTETAGRPIRVIDPLSGRPFLRFDGLDDVLVTRRRMAVQTVFAVTREAGHATKSHSALVGDFKYSHFNRGGDRLVYYPKGHFAGKDTKVRLDGRPIDPVVTRLPENLFQLTSTSPTPMSLSLIGSDRLVPDRNWHGDIGELLAFNRELDAVEIATVEAWLKAKWGLPSIQWHTNFRVSSGETIRLTQPLGQAASAVWVPPCPPDSSLGQAPGIHGNFHFANPTPGLANTTPHAFGWLEAPRLVKPPGRYAEAIDLALESPDKNSTLRYTLDGSEPDAGATLYAGPIRLAKPTVVRARAFRDGFLPGPIVTGSYFVGEKTAFPIASISTDPGNLFDPDRGIYTEGRDYLNGTPEPVYNFKCEWERPAYFEWFEPGESLGLGRDIGLRIHGGWTRHYYQKSLRLYARPRYGEATFHHRFFPNLQLGEFRRLILRNAGNGWKTAFMRDAVGHDLTARMGFEFQAWRPTVVYLNGQFWGIHNLRERIDSHYLSAHTGHHGSEIDLLQHTVKSGDMKHWQQVTAIINAWETLEPDERIAQLEAMVDIDNLMDYIILEVFLDNTDWPRNNVRQWRPRTADGRWRWIPYDLDGILGTAGHNATYNTLHHTVLHFPGHPPDFIRVLQKLLTHPRYRQRFIHRFAMHMQGDLSAERILHAVQAKQTALEPEMARHILRWRKDVGAIERGEKEEEWSLPLWDIYDWRAQVRKLRDFATNRHEQVWRHLRKGFLLDDPATLTLAEPDSRIRSVNVEGVPMKKTDGVWSARLFTGQPMRLTIQSHDGWEIAGWENDSAPGPDRLFTLKTDTALRPQFAKRSQFRITSVEPTDHGAMQIVYEQLGTKAHRLEVSSNLIDWTLERELPAALGQANQNVRIKIDSNSPARFFRIVAFP